MRASGYVVSGVVCICVAAALNVAHADSGRIALMTEPARAGDYHAALQLTLRGIDIAALPAPTGPLRLDRAADAQRGTLAAGADAGVWIEYDAGLYEVCVVSADGRAFRHAPLPSDGTPRIFAAIATSLLDELLAPPEANLPPINVDVQVHIGSDAAPDDAAVAAPGLIAAASPSSATPPPFAIADTTRPVRFDRTLVELGPMLSPVSIGVEATMLFPVTERTRVGAMAFAHTLLPDGPSLLLGAGLEARRVGRGRRHFDIGVIGGAASAQSDPAIFLSAHLGLVWERERTGLGLSLAPTVVIPMEGGSLPIIPALFASLRWMLPV
jgi:hypothetical protein